MRLIGVVSCWKEAAHRQAIRDTWAKEIPTGWDLKFFLGGSSWVPETDPAVLEFIGPPGTLAVMHHSKAQNPPIRGVLLQDEVLLDCPDSYLGTAWKGKAIQQYALQQNYDGLFLAMCDTLVFPSMLQKACVGLVSAQVFTAAPAKAYPISGVRCPHGGYGYWLSQRALEAIDHEPVRHYSEDQNTAFALHHAKIPIFANSYFNQSRLGGIRAYRAVSQHLSTKGQEFLVMDITNAWRESQRTLDRWPGWDGVCKRCGEVRFKDSLYGPQCITCHSRKPMV